MTYRKILIGLAGVALLGMTACQRGGAASGSGSSASSAASPAVTAAPSGPTPLSELPHRKPGLWTTTMTRDGAPTAMPVVELCVDAASDARMSALGAGMSKDKCRAQSFSRNLDGSISFSSTCAMTAGLGGEVNSHGTVTGSFDSEYTVALDMVTTGASPASVNGERKMTVTAKWEGPCPAAMKGGDMAMTMPNGSKIKVAGPGGSGG
jgi:hypothetical protein